MSSRVPSFQKCLGLFLLIQLPLFSFGQYTHDDTLRGSITQERSWWNLLHYDLFVKVFPETKTISGYNTIDFQVVEEQKMMQIDLQSPLKIDSIVENGSILNYSKIGTNAYLVELNSTYRITGMGKITIYYSGKPREAVNAPWDGGIVWTKTPSGKPYIATACQGLGASVWWPCKDHMYDEPDNGMTISVNTPADVMNVSNGKLLFNKVQDNGTRTTKWEVVNPINNYGVNMNIADYTHWSEIYSGENGNLEMNFYVLPENLEKSKLQFKDASRTMEALEHWFGPYPFYEDGYKLVEVPYLGMEHQSSVTYGNKYKNGYLGMDLSMTGWGLKWDYIIIHESGHEWFANNITYKDCADMWIHEGFTSYSEALFTEYFYGKVAGFEYVRGLRRGIRNDAPIIGDYNVNSEGSGDMYPKGANLLHTIRQIINNDDKWRSILRGLNEDFYHQTVTTAQIENYISEKSGIDLSKIFDQYLRNISIPNLLIKQKGKTISYAWKDVISDFNMPVDVIIDNKPIRLYPTLEPKTIKGKKITVSKDYYIE